MIVSSSSDFPLSANTSAEVFRKLVFDYSCSLNDGFRACPSASNELGALSCVSVVQYRQDFRLVTRVAQASPASSSGIIVIGACYGPCCGVFSGGDLC